MIRKVLFSPPSRANSSFPRAYLDQWLVREGQHIEAGVSLCRYEIDKAVGEFAAPFAGWVRRLLRPEGARLAKNELMAVMSDQPDEFVSLAIAEPPSNESAFDWSEIDNTAGSAVPLPVMRKAIADRMAMSKRHIPCFYLTVTVDMTACIQRRQAMRKNGQKATFNDMILRAAAIAISRHPAIASIFTPEGIVPRAEINIGFAAALPDDGLVVPVVKNADRKPLHQVAAEARDLAIKAHQGKLEKDDCAGGIFTVSYLGAYEVDNFVAVVNPGESAIIAVGKNTDTPVAIDGRIEIRPLARITMSSDHRSIDGVLSARFMGEIKHLLEHADEL